MAAQMAGPDRGWSSTNLHAQNGIDLARDADAVLRIGRGHRRRVAGIPVIGRDARTAAADSSSARVVLPACSTEYASRATAVRRDMRAWAFAMVVCAMQAVGFPPP